MCSQPSITASSLAAPAGSVCTPSSPAARARATRPFRGWLARLAAPRPALTRLGTEGLSEHRLRDLGFADGRPAAPRDPLRD